MPSIATAIAGIIICAFAGSLHVIKMIIVFSRVKTIFIHRLNYPLFLSILCSIACVILEGLSVAVFAVQIITHEFELYDTLAKNVIIVLAELLYWVAAFCTVKGSIYRYCRIETILPTSALGKRLITFQYCLAIFMTIIFLLRVAFAFVFSSSPWFLIVYVIPNATGTASVVIVDFLASALMIRNILRTAVKKKNPRQRLQKRIQIMFGAILVIDIAAVSIFIADPNETILHCAAFGVLHAYCSFELLHWIKQNVHEGNAREKTATDIQRLSSVSVRIQQAASSLQNEELEGSEIWKASYD